MFITENPGGVATNPPSEEVLQKMAQEDEGYSMLLNFVQVLSWKSASNIINASLFEKCNSPGGLLKTIQ